jgi:hypothetical protein
MESANSHSPPPVDNSALRVHLHSRQDANRLPLS